MYFVVYKNNNEFRKLTFSNEASWDHIISEIKGEVIEIFQNDNLELEHFDDYFQFNYKKKKK